MVDVVQFGDPERDADRDQLEEIEEELGTAAEERAVSKRSDTSVRAAMVMAMQGASYADIARVLDYDSPGAAKAAVERAVADSGGDLAQDRATLRGVMSSRLEFWLRSIAPKIIADGPSQLDYMSMGLRLADRRIKLLGLDMPTQIELIDPGHEEFAEFVQKLVAKAGMEPTPEGDPFAEVDDLVEGEDGVWRRAEG